MRKFGDRERGGNRDRWDADVEFIPIDKKPRRVRLVGPLQDIALHWLWLSADEYAEKMYKAKQRAIRLGKEFKPPREPKGVPFHCPQFDLYREKFIQYRDVETGEGLLTKETVSARELHRHGIKVPKKHRKSKFSKRSFEEKRPVLAEKVHCPAHDDFNLRANKRTWWHAFERRVTSSGKVRGNAGFGVLGKSSGGGIPITCYIQLEKIAKVRQMDPSHPKHGFDLMIFMDKDQPAQQMYDVREIRGEDTHPLTKQEIREAFGRYLLRDKTKCNFMDIIQIRHEDPDRLKGMKVVEPAGIWPLEEMAAAAIDPEGMKEFMVEQGFYEADGTPRAPLVYQKDEDDNSWAEREEPEDEFGDDDSEEVEVEKPRRRRKKKRRKKSSSEGKKRRSKKSKRRRKKRRSTIEDE